MGAVYHRAWRSEENLLHAGTFLAFAWWFVVLVFACRKDRSGMSGLQVVYGIAMGKWASLEVVINTRIESTCKINSIQLNFNYCTGKTNPIG